MADAVFHLFEDGPRPVAPYSHVVELADCLFVTGQLPIDDNHMVPESIEAQTRQVFTNLARVLEKVDASLADIVSARVFLTDFYAHYERMNKIYSTYFPNDRYPARTCVGVTALARGCHIEIDLIAKRPK
jgi:reactive intermediate/imine deaminase